LSALQKNQVLLWIQHFIAFLKDFYHYTLA
jgi:hypothetical protein